MLEAILDSQDYIIFRDKEQTTRSVMIDDLGLAATDFNITQEQKNNLITSGANAAKAFIAKAALLNKNNDVIVTN